MRRAISVLMVAGLLMVPASALAMTRSQARAKASGWQHWFCGHAVAQECDNWNLIYPSCNGPYRGQIQWNCTGFTAERFSNGRSTFCEYETSWNPWGGIVHNWEGCSGTIGVKGSERRVV